MAHKTENFSTEPLGNLTIIIGLPGSGKTSYIATLADKNPQLAIYDDYQGESYGPDADPRLSKHFGPLVSNLKQAKSAVVSDIRYCIPSELNAFLSVILGAAPNTRIQLKYFENNPEACKKNILARQREGRVEKELELLEKLSKGYETVMLDQIPVFKG